MNYTTMKSTTAQRARAIANTLGTRSAAGYLRNRRIPLDSALLILGFGAEKSYWLRHAPSTGKGNGKVVSNAS